MDSGRTVYGGQAFGFSFICVSQGVARPTWRHPGVKQCWSRLSKPGLEGKRGEGGLILG